MVMTLATAMVAARASPAVAHAGGSGRCSCDDTTIKDCAYAGGVSHQCRKEAAAGTDDDDDDDSYEHNDGGPQPQRSGANTWFDDTLATAGHD